MHRTRRAQVGSVASKHACNMHVSWHVSFSFVFRSHRGNTISPEEHVQMKRKLNDLIRRHREFRNIILSGSWRFTLNSTMQLEHRSNVTIERGVDPSCFSPSHVVAHVLQKRQQPKTSRAVSQNLHQETATPSPSQKVVRPVLVQLHIFPLFYTPALCFGFCFCCC